MAQHSRIKKKEKLTMGAHQATHDDVCGALQKEADDWKAAAAFSFCTGAVEKLFPTSLGAGLIARAAIPIWIYTEACKLYDQTFNNKLPGEAMKAFTDAENQIWNNRRA
jgi:hypothetical protein